MSNTITVEWLKRDCRFYVFSHATGKLIARCKTRAKAVDAGLAWTMFNPGERFKIRQIDPNPQD